MTVTASYNSASATCTIRSLFFVDNGVTNDYNSNYTNLNGTINVNVSSTGTNISCSTYADCYRRADAVISGDFEITYNIVSKTNYSGGFAFFNTSNSIVFLIEFAESSEIDFLRTGNRKSYSNYSTDSIVKVTRVGNKITLYLDDVEIANESSSNYAVDGYFAWKTHIADGRNFTFKYLRINSL